MKQKRFLRDAFYRLKLVMLFTKMDEIFTLTASHFSVSETQMVEDVLLLKDNEGAITAVFQSGSFLTVSASNSILSVSFAGSSDLLRGVTKGLLGKKGFKVFIHVVSV